MLTQAEIRVLTLRQAGLTQVQVARRLKITQAAVSKFERNAHQKFQAAKEALALAKKLHIEVES